MTSRTSPDLHRHAKRTLYIVAGFYVLVGLVIATASALGGDRLGTFLGFLIVSGAIGGAVLLRAILQVESCMLATSAELKDLRRRLERMDRTVTTLVEQLMPTASSSNSGVRILDLAAMGTGDPSTLTAATLEPLAYPRLATSQDEDVPAMPDGTDEEAWTVQAPQGNNPAPAEGMPTKPSEPLRDDENDDAATTRELLAQCDTALRNEDLGGCRAIYAALVDVAGEDALRLLAGQIKSLADRVEHALRQAFVEHVRRRDYAAAVAIGERICHLLAGRPIVDDFRRLQPLLLRRAQQSALQVQGA